MGSIPYAGARAGANARNETIKLLARFGCDAVGFMDDFSRHAVTLSFKYRGHPIQLRASADGWAAMWLKENPWNSRRKVPQEQWRILALQQGMLAVNSILRDWIKGQITAIETGVLSFEDIFTAHMLLPDGSRLVEHVGKFISHAKQQEATR